MFAECNNAKSLTSGCRQILFASADHCRHPTPFGWPLSDAGSSRCGCSCQVPSSQIADQAGSTLVTTNVYACYVCFLLGSLSLVVFTVSLFGSSGWFLAVQNSRHSRDQINDLCTLFETRNGRAQCQLRKIWFNRKRKHALYCAKI